ncbi:hypothetical protein [Rhizobium mayense]|uniref:hypothetical protein n=1 Tax=Rhizobium mayense TaxID=1312184 RepID=UPI00398C5D69
MLSLFHADLTPVKSQMEDHAREATTFSYAVAATAAFDEFFESVLALCFQAIQDGNPPRTFLELL